MRFANTVEHPKGLTRRQLRKSIKYRLLLKKKLGYKKNEPVYDKQLGVTK